MVLITGGAASGKSRYAASRAGALGPKVLFVATCKPADPEMKAKVARHRAERPPSWTTVEADQGLVQALRPGFDAVVVDCLTLYLSQALFDQGRTEAAVRAELAALPGALPCPLFVVTNEVGQGVVPDFESGRLFRDALGRLNADLAAAAEEVWLMVSGLPLKVKPA